MEGIQVSTQVAGSQNQVSVIKVGGFIDTTTSSEVDRALTGLLKQNRFNVIIDLGNVDYISSAGWGIFISEIKAIRDHNGDLKLVNMIPDVYEIFELLEFHHILEVFETVEEAVQKFEEKVQKPAATTVTREPITASPVSAGGGVADEIFSERVDESSIPEGTKVTERKIVGEAKSQVQSVPLHMQSLTDKVKYIVANYPQYGAYKINKLLNSEQFGFTKVGWFGVRSLLSKLELNSRKNRNIFSQSYLNKKD